MEKYYLRNNEIRALIKIENLTNEKLNLIKSEDALNDIKKIRFKLDLGLFSNLELQKDYENTGLELFTIEIDKEIEKDKDINKALIDRIAELKSQGKEFY